MFAASSTGHGPCSCVTVRDIVHWPPSAMRRGSEWRKKGRGSTVLLNILAKFVSAYISPPPRDSAPLTLLSLAEAGDRETPPIVGQKGLMGNSKIAYYNGWYYFIQFSAKHIDKEYLDYEIRVSKRLLSSGIWRRIVWYMHHNVRRHIQEGRNLYNHGCGTTNLVACVQLFVLNAHDLGQY
jgi:hypothetical protein